MRKETETKTPTGAATEDTAWRRYPHIEAAIESDNPAIVLTLESHWHDVERLVRTGTPSEKERAGAVLGAYGRALDLYRELTGVRDRLLQTGSNICGGTAINK